MYNIKPQQDLKRPKVIRNQLNRDRITDQPPDKADITSGFITELCWVPSHQMR